MAASFNTLSAQSISTQSHCASSPSPTYFAYHDPFNTKYQSMEQPDFVVSQSCSPVSPTVYSPLTYNSKSISPQPCLYQVPPLSSTNFHNLPKVPDSNYPINSNPSSSFALASASFSLSTINCRVTSNHQHHYHNPTELTCKSTISGAHKSTSHYSANRLTKTDILLDRKAFINLEKSINWQSLLTSDASSCISSSSILSRPMCSTTPSVSISHESASLSEVPSFRHTTNVETSHQCNVDNDQIFENPTENFFCSTSSQAPISPNSEYYRHFQVTEFAVNATANQSSVDREFTLPGMKDVPTWLKLLRLHKYAPFFGRMSYEEMLDLTEDVLEHRNITKGARQKLILSIQKLKARSAVLLASEQELLEPDGRRYRDRVSYSSLSQVLFQIRAFLSTPIRPSISESQPKCAPATSYCPSSSSTYSSAHSLCSSSSHSSPSLSPPFLSSTPVDFNNNNHHQGNYNLAGACARSLDSKELIRRWFSLTSDDLPNIMTRLIGHVHHILVGKCKKRLKKFSLWQEYFKDIYDKLSAVPNAGFSTQERDVCERYSQHDTSNSPEQVNDSDREEHDDDEEDSVVIDFDSGATLDCDTSTSPSSSSNGTDKDSGVDESDNCSLDSDILTIEQEEELYMVMRTILVKCLSHEAFSLHQTLLVYWHEQLKCMISTLRFIINDPAAPLLRASSPNIGAKSYSPDFGFYSGTRYSNNLHCKSPLQYHSMNGLAKHKFTSMQSCKKSPNSGYPKSNASTNNAGLSSVGRRLLHNRLRPPINHGTNSTSTSSSSNSMHRSATFGSVLPSEEKLNTRRNSCFKSASKCSSLDSAAAANIASSSPSSPCFQGALYSNLSVIPRLSNLFSSPITLNFNPSAAIAAANSPEVNLRNLLLQQLLNTQQQSPQPQAPQAHSIIDYNGAAATKYCSTSSATGPIKLPSSIDSSPLGVDMTANCLTSSGGQFEKDDSFAYKSEQPSTSPTELESGTSLWSLNEPIDNSKKLDWNATDLLASLDRDSSKLEDVLNLLDHNLDMSLKIDWPNNHCSTTMAGTIDDIEQLCIRMAEHALEMNDDSFYT